MIQITEPVATYDKDKVTFLVLNAQIFQLCNHDKLVHSPQVAARYGAYHSPGCRWCTPKEDFLEVIRTFNHSYREAGYVVQFNPQDTALIGQMFINFHRELALQDIVPKNRCDLCLQDGQVLLLISPKSIFMLQRHETLLWCTPIAKRGQDKLTLAYEPNGTEQDIINMFLLRKGSRVILLDKSEQHLVTQFVKEFHNDRD